MTNPLDMLRFKLQDLRRLLFQTRDRNFIGFPKYRNHGAYHWRNLSHSDTYQRLVKYVVGHVAPTARCLDLGCGDAACTGAVAQVCHETVGVDADFDAIRLAKTLLFEHGIQNCQVYQTPLSQVSRILPTATNSFDIVYAIDVIEHLPNPEELLHVAANCCKPRGVVLIGTPVFQSRESMSIHHVREYTVDEFRSLMTEHFAVVRIETIPYQRGKGDLIPDGYMFAVAQCESARLATFSGSASRELFK